MDILVGLAVFAGCLVAPEDSDAGSNDGGSAATVNDGGTRCLDIAGSEGTVCATLSPVVCGGRACSAGAVCCQTTGQCVSPGSFACPVPATPVNNARACGSSADCASDQYCIPDDWRPASGGPQVQRCISSSGHCEFLSFCSYCGGGDNGAVLNCASHSECNGGAGGGNGGEPTRLCAGDGCAGPGLCSNRGSSSSCGGEVQSVCGCDGVTYINACWARAAGTRVASNGVCP